MKLKKQFLAFLLAVCMLVSLNGYGITAYADDGETPPPEDAVIARSSESEGNGGDDEELPEEPVPPLPEETAPALPEEPIIEPEPVLSEDYLSKIPYDQLTGVIADDLIRIAESQMGYRESEINTVTDGDGAIQGYSEYGAWYGDDYMPWNTVFVFFCLHCANYVNQAMTYHPDCTQWLAMLRQAALTAEPETILPRAGDLVFTRDGAGNTRVGIITAVRGIDGGTVLTAVEGDCGGSVASREYSLEGGVVLAFLPLSDPGAYEKPQSREDSGEQGSTAQNTSVSGTVADGLSSPEFPEEPEADTPTLEEVVAKLPVRKLTGHWAADLLTIARSQIGYCESRTDFVLGKNDEEIGYTCYGDYFGLPYGEWCAMFICFCLDYAAVPSDSFPRNAVCSLWVEQLQEMGLYKTVGEYTPLIGDVVFWGETEATAAHVGIVSGVTETAKYGRLLTVIEGNVDACVGERNYYIAETSIIGYGALSIAQIIEIAGRDVFADENRSPYAIKPGTPSVQTASGWGYSWLPSSWLTENMFYQNGTLTFWNMRE